MARACVLAGAVGSGLSVQFTETSRQVAGLLGLPRALESIGVIAASALTLSVLVDLAALPFLVYSRCVLEQRYRAVRVGVLSWLRGYARAMGLHVSIWMLSAVSLYAIISVWPNRWWVVAGVVFALVTIAMTHLGPIVVFPRLYDLRPLCRPGLHARLSALTRRVGTSVVAIQEWRLGLDAPGPNAALVGLGSTRRVLISDALLAHYSDDEIEVVLAHELAHHVNYDIWKTIAVETVMAIVACGAAHLAMGWVTSGSLFSGVDDVSGLPLLVAVSGSVVMLLAPIRHGLSRRHERRADRYALDVTHNPEAMVSSLRRLGEQTLAEERPSRLVEWLFCTHPPLVERVAAAQAAPEDSSGVRSRYRLD